MARARHPNKHIEDAVKYAESLGWDVRLSNGHAWGRLLCPRHTREGCAISVWSTPRNPESHARQIRRDIDTCPHQQGDQALFEEEEEGGEHLGT